MKEYFDSMGKEFSKALSLSNKAKASSWDPSDSVEIAIAPDVAARVEGLVGPKGIAERIRSLLKDKTREEACFELCKELVEPFAGETSLLEVKEKALEQAVRTSLALFTEGVVSAPIEGVSKVLVKKNFDGSTYASVYFAGPIRGAGGTGQAFTLLLADYGRKILGIGNYRPTSSEVERAWEELKLYSRRTRVGQYLAVEDEIKHVVSNCPVCVNGDPTEDYEVAVNKNVPGIDGNRVRGGMCLVMTEGICLKAAKVMKIAKRAGLNWQWLESLIKVAKEDAKKVELKPVEKYMEELVAGRPIFAYPMRSGGLRLRYGRTPYTGIAAKALHPATMAILDYFPAIGTQVKVERPGKGCIITPCDSIEGPLVKLNDGSVKLLDDAEEAAGLFPSVEEIIYLGDLLVCYGDFLKSNHPLVESSWCEEWMKEILLRKGVEKSQEELCAITFDEAMQFCKQGFPLAPKFTFHWAELQRQELLELAEWLSTGKADFDWFDFKGLKIPKGEAKRRLEILGVPHEASVMGEVLIHGEWAKALCECLCLIEDKKISARKFKEVFEANPEMDALELVNLVSGFEVKKKAGVFVGASMGRPEKSRERKMEPPVNSLFPVGNAGGRMRSVPKAAGERVVEAELCVRSCPKCGLKNFLGKCECGSRTDLARECEKCCKVSKNEKCECGGETKQTSQRQVALQTLFERACERTNERPKEVKAVIGLISREKVPESLEKGILRAKHDLSVFRDGTIRFDSTEIPATHFTPEEIGVSVAELRELGYDKDFEGRELLSPGQTVELKVQDAIISRDNADYFVKIAKFVDDELVYYYGEKPFYNCENTRDVLGKQCIAIAPHTSAGILCRVIGFTDAYGIVAHPYLHCATRRNCDGDELALILLMDGLLNFSRHFLPETRGGQMDAPLVLTTVMDPREVDDEAHAMDSAFSYPLEFYEATLKRANPSEAKVETISSRLGTERQFSGIGFTHKAKFKGPLRSRYLEFKSMPEKVEEEITLMKKIRAVDYKDATERIISSHFFPDLYGNLRKFGKQKFRCVDCNVKYRRVPLAGKCSKCNGKLLLTVNKGGIEKYLSISKELVERFQLPDYLRQRLMLLEKEIKSVFEDEKSKQFSLADFA